MSKWTSETSKDEIIDAIRELAADKGQVPTKRMWLRWDGSPCGVTGIRERFGGWDDALAAAELPRSPPGPVTSEVRSALYQKHIETEVR